jgi:hypothetical protein
MKPELVQNFVNNSIIKPGSELLVSYKNENSFGLPSNMKTIFKVVRIISDKGKYYFTLASIDDGQRTLVASSDQISEVDGMTSERIIRAFNLSEDGTKKPRKPRKRKNKDLEVETCQKN